VRAATALLDAGASAKTGFWNAEHQPEPEWESAMYGAAGVAHHPEITRLLLERGADPNDEETPYHAPEEYDNSALKVLVESEKLTAESLVTMLVRKADWHDYEGIQYLLGKGADPNRMTRWGYTALHQAVRRDNDAGNIEVMLDHGADPALLAGDGQSAVVMAARRGRGDVLDLFDRRGVPLVLDGVNRLIAACASRDAELATATAVQNPSLAAELISQGGTLLAQFAGNGNTEGARLLLALGVDVNALYKEGDGYFGIARQSTALHVSAWRGWHRTVKFLIDQGASVNARDGNGRTAIALAVRACVDSYWTHRRAPDSVDSLLKAGAWPHEAPFPSGYQEVDDLLRAAGR
jgi:ankyrin repeat protein